VGRTKEDIGLPPFKKNLIIACIFPGYYTWMMREIIYIVTVIIVVMADLKKVSEILEN